ncbi:S24 family peptidase [Bradyrhizobium sp. LA2.1]|uniref:LexA family transcriptional regulator n=1 Tax=Bradyrhizobium sp. LA2.1 TaxID=3156376 RepID=UPI00339223F2
MVRESCRPPSPRSVFTRFNGRAFREELERDLGFSEFGGGGDDPRPIGRIDFVSVLHDADVAVVDVGGGTEFGWSAEVFDYVSECAHPKSLQNVAIKVKTARNDLVVTRCNMDESALRKAQGERLTAARKAAGYRSAREAALENGWKESSYRTHEAGTRTIGMNDAERYARRFNRSGAKTSARQIMFGDEEEAAPAEASLDERRTVVPIMGRIGGGAQIEPDYEQAPPDGLDQVELPIIIAGDVIGFEVAGDSMLPKYSDGTVVVVFRDPERAISSLLGEEAAVVTAEGHRYLKVLKPGSKAHLYNLESFNARPIVDVRLSWASEIVAIVPKRQVRNVARQKSTKAAARSQRGIAK